MLKLAPSKPHAELARLFSKSFSLKSGRPVLRLPSKSGFQILASPKGVIVSAATDSDWFRALGELAANPGLRRLSRVAPLSFRGMMMEASRNAVIQPGVLKDYLAGLALLGYNAFCLYTEDTFEVKGHPLIGYRRGRLSQAELRGLDRHAALFGIEMFPCIQTLGHLTQILKFRKYWDLRDTEHVLSVEKKETYRLLEAMIASAAAPYRTKRIHIGMDETWGLGTGSVFKAGKPIYPRALYLKHLAWVGAACRRRGLKPLMWGDMLLSEHLGKGRSRLPKGMDMVYWNYYSRDQKLYERDLDKCLKLGARPMVAPGVWTWDRLWSNAFCAVATMTPLLRAAKRKGLDRALMTLWGDDGHEAPFSSAWPGLAAFAQECWEKAPAPAASARMLKGLWGLDWKDFTATDRMDLISAGVRKAGGNPSKALLYDDPLQRLFASHAPSWPFQRYYAAREAELRGLHAKAPARLKGLFRQSLAIAGALKAKAELGNQARRAYKRGDKAALRRMLRELPATRAAVRRAWQAQRSVWLEERKPFGLELLDKRYGLLLARLEVFGRVLKKHLSGRLPRIAEFDEADQNYMGEFQKLGNMWMTGQVVASISALK